MYLSKENLELEFSNAVNAFTVATESVFPQQKKPLLNLLEQAKNVVSHYKVYDEVQRKRVFELIKVLFGTIALTKYQAIDPELVKAMNREMASGSFFDKKINRIFAGISIIIVGMATIALAAYLTPILCTSWPFSTFTNIQFSLMLFTPLLMFVGCDMALFSSPRSVAEELREVVPLFLGPTYSVQEINKTNYSRGWSDFFSNKKLKQNKEVEVSSQNFVID